MSFLGAADMCAEFLTTEHLKDEGLWKKFVDIFRTRPDGINRGWKGEYWGKMMRGAVLVYKYNEDEALYNVLTDSVRDILTVIEGDGRLSSYPRENEFISWDLWSRKYVILACEYYLEICKSEEFKKEIIEFISRVADYIIAHIGEGKIKITKASNHWLGLNSSSILEPIVRLYRLTGEMRYLDFASYIVECGGAEGINIFDLAYKNNLYPYQYGVSKAYEMTSCFEGLIEYYEVTGIEKYKTAVLNYARAILESEISIIGCAGTTHELFDHTKTRETEARDKEEVLQETCVTVTLMKFFERVIMLTKDSIYADLIEKSFYNAYLGALNTERCESEYPSKVTENVVSTILPFDAYSPLTAGRRGKVVGGYQVLPDLTYYGCCACIGAAGVGVFFESAVLVQGDAVTVNFYERGTVIFEMCGATVTMNIDTDYPSDGRVKIGIKAEKPTEFTLKLRNPGWSDKGSGYSECKRVWSNDSIELCFDMPIKIHYPEYVEEDTVYTNVVEDFGGYYTALPARIKHSENEKNYFAITRGPLTLASDSRMGKAADSQFHLPDKFSLCENVGADGKPCFVKMRFERGGEEFFLIDYAHAGLDWKSDIAAWLRIK